MTLLLLWAVAIFCAFLNMRLGISPDSFFAASLVISAIGASK